MTRRSGARVRAGADPRPRAARLALALVMGRRLPRTSGRLEVTGVDGPVVVRRDHWGIPHVDATTSDDAWFALGFCQGQDRSFQLEVQLRAVRGTLAELFGAEAVPIDRLSRRLGLRAVGAAQLAASDSDARGVVAAFCRGVNAGRTTGSTRRAHELALLRRQPTTFEEADVAAVGPLVSLLLGANWDLELARLRVLVDDGPAALRAVEPGPAPGSNPASNPASTPRSTEEPLPGLSAAAPASAGLGQLEDEVARLRFVLGGSAASGSNAWVLAGGRTRSGRPLLAADPHLAPTVPALWYLAHLRAPGWELAGASVVGGPAVPVGMNAQGSFAITNAYSDTSDLVVEELSPDGAHVRRGQRWVPCQRRVEVIGVRRGAPRHEDVVVTPAGPVISPVVDGERHVLALRATWLQAGTVRAPTEHATTWQGFRAAHEGWPSAGLNVLWAGDDGTIGHQLVGHHPRRPGPAPLLPASGSEDQGWALPPLALDELPHISDPPAGLLVSANDAPVGAGPELGHDWGDGWRAARLRLVLTARRDWDVAASGRLQLDRLSTAWATARTAVLALGAAAVDDAEARAALEQLSGWDGSVDESSVAATLWQFFLAELGRSLLAARAPRSWAWAAGTVPLPLVGGGFGRRRTGWLVELLVAGDPQATHLAVGALARAQRSLVARGQQAWGVVRPLTMRHLVGRRPMDRIFELGPVPFGGDGTTVAQAMPPFLDPAADPAVVPTLRFVVDLGDRDGNRVSLAGGQSGNPASPHYADLFGPWLAGEGVPLAWSEEAVAAATRRTLTLAAAGPDATAATAAGGGGGGGGGGLTERRPRWLDVGRRGISQLGQIRQLGQISSSARSGSSAGSDGSGNQGRRLNQARDMTAAATITARPAPVNHRPTSRFSVS